MQGQQPSTGLLDRRGEAGARSNSCVMVVVRMVERLTDLVQGRLRVQPWSGEQLSKQQVSPICPDAGALATAAAALRKAARQSL